MKKSFRHASAQELALMLREAHDYTLSLFECFVSIRLDDPATLPVIRNFKPPIWDLGHLAWFAEWLVLRDASLLSVPSSPTKMRPSMLSKGDVWFAPHSVIHDVFSALPKAAHLITYKNEVLDRVLDKLGRVANTDEALYPYRMALAFEDMHGEYWVALLQVLGLRAPMATERHICPPWAQSEINVPGGNLMMGSMPNNGFVFDSEKWSHLVYVPTFAIDSNLISNMKFAEFVEDDGYQRPQYWSTLGQHWLMQQERSAPINWTRDGNWWRCARFGRDISLSASEPIRHVCLYEAQAYCMWAKRRLPTEAEWEFATVSGHAALRWGDLWEWTCSAFEPYPGFAPEALTFNVDPEEAFVTHQSVRGASFATPSRMRSERFRNFLLPENCENLIGFRTCRQ